MFVKMLEAADWTADSWKRLSQFQSAGTPEENLSAAGWSCDTQVMEPLEDDEQEV